MTVGQDFWMLKIKTIISLSYKIKSTNFFCLYIHKININRTYTYMILKYGIDYLFSFYLNWIFYFIELDVSWEILNLYFY